MSRAEWQTMYREALDGLEVEEPVTILLNNGAGFDPYPTEAVVRGYNERDLVPGGTIQQGDIKVLISADRYPAAINRKLERKDRIEINGAPCAVIHFDDNTRNIQGVPIMYEIAVRG